MLQVQTTEVAGWWIQVLAERGGEREIGDLVRWVGDVGRVCDYVPGQPGSYGRGKLGDEREPGKVGGFGELAGLARTQTDNNQTLALQSSDTLKGFSVYLS